MPIANYKGGSLLYDIKKKKPSVNIKEGIFYNDIDGYSIKIENKSNSENLLNNILIYDHTDNTGNKKVISAKSGKMVIWPPYWTHFHRSQVSPSSIKYIMTGWICEKNPLEI